MPIINGRYYMNSGYGRAIERDRLAEAFARTRPADVRTAYESSMRAARRAYLSPTDPTSGAIYMYFPTTDTLGNFSPPPHNPPGYGIRTHAGPYNNSFPNQSVPSRTVWLNTYEP